MEKIIFPIKTELEVFENKLKEVIASCDNFLMQDLNKFMFQKAKRLRPILIFFFAKILKIESPFVLDIALITELIHSASVEFSRQEYSPDISFYRVSSQPKD